MTLASLILTASSFLFGSGLLRDIVLVRQIQSDDRPIVELISPRDGDTFTAGQSISLVANTVAPAGRKIKKIEFYMNDLKIAQQDLSN